MVFPKIASGILLSLICISSLVLIQKPRLQQLSHGQKNPSDYFIDEKQSQISLEFLRQLPTLGFDNLIANWSFLQFLQYFGDSPARKVTGYSLNPQYFELIVDRDPRFISAYLYCSSATSLFAGRPDLSVAILEKGLQSISPQTASNAFFLWIYKAIDELLFLGNNAAARKSYEMASKWARLYDTPEAKRFAVSALRTANFIAKNPASKRAQVSAWSMILSSASDSRTQELAIQRIQALGGEVSITTKGSAKIVEVRLPEVD